MRISSAGHTKSRMYKRHSQKSSENGKLSNHCGLQYSADCKVLLYIQCWIRKNRVDKNRPIDGIVSL